MSIVHDFYRSSMSIFHNFYGSSISIVHYYFRSSISIVHYYYRFSMSIVNYYYRSSMSIVPLYYRSSMSGCSLPETEDLYCDDELHPSLENDPNMQLFTSALLRHQLQEYSEQPIFQSLDGGQQLLHGIQYYKTLTPFHLALIYVNGFVTTKSVVII